MNIGIVGDTHGNFRTYLSAKADTLISVGDNEIGFPTHRRDALFRLNDSLHKMGKVVFMIRGNHDDPSYFQGAHIYSNLHLLPDYTKMVIGKVLFGFVGGAYSIDRAYRTEGLDYWEEEPFLLDEKKAKTLKGVDVLITHSAPLNYPPVGVDSPICLVCAAHEAMMGLDLLDDLKRERDELSRLVDIVKPSQHFYGHFHSKAATETKYGVAQLLNIDEVYYVD